MTTTNDGNLKQAVADLNAAHAQKMAAARTGGTDPVLDAAIDDLNPGDP